MVHIVRMDPAVVDELSEPAGEGVGSVSDGPVFGPCLDEFIMVFGEIDSQYLVIGLAYVLHMRRYGNDESRDGFLPHGPDRGDINHLAERIVVAERLIFRPVSDRQKRAVGAGMAAQFVAGHSRTDMGGYFLHPFVKIQDLMIILPDDEDAGRRYGAQYFFIFFNITVSCFRQNVQRDLI